VGTHSKVAKDASSKILLELDKEGKTILEP